MYSKSKRAQANNWPAAWAGRVAEYFKSRTAEVNELLITLAGTAGSMGQRDLRYSAQFGGLTRQLQALADLEDLGQVRTALVQKAADLKGRLDRMAAENREAVVQLKANVSQYESRLKEAETLVGKDGLTGRFNRRVMEQPIEAAIADKKPFCVAVLDLNRFKQVNDAHGQQVGDSLLTQFAQELRSNIRSADLCWALGGDECVLLFACDMEGARAPRSNESRSGSLAKTRCRWGVDASRESRGPRFRCSGGKATWGNVGPKEKPGAQTAPEEGRYSASPVPPAIEGTRRTSSPS